MAGKLSCIALIAGFALVCVLAAEELYSDRFDNIDLPTIFANNKLRRQYSTCLSGSGPCVTAPQKFFKEIFGEALQTQCRRCTDKQKEMFEYMIEWFTTNAPADWEEMVRVTLENLQKTRAQQTQKAH